MCNPFLRPLPPLALVLPLLLGTGYLQAEEQRDPMRPPAAASTSQVSKKSVQHYHLSSILISPSHRSAIINTKRVSVGERIDNARVVEIRGNGVILSVAGKTRTLALLPISIKKPVEASPQ
ncbi:MAG: general secretion pathway protein GspB [Gammaproteobacteria bacterium]|nr:general secretion pathway protein GspB [Gammaproteobacteria bacterium]MCW8841384.1 general secretion pathway protein GspB [Gammaproteobacteria bacterium]MCW8927822.1 general secretion pathway protein GspB [Gammaproteobacteria bacterium]MCW8958588.1 general secretion pathway protein GspB [Gammaproteobacteria bacterium]MCW8974025.1 general secretion pathway protein GspB [Gammaproteobacteria bacterium]